MKGPKEVRDWINERRETAKREAAEYALAALQCQRHDCQALRAEVELLKVDLDETIKDSHKQLAEVERLTGCLTQANAQAERFERQWYLRGDELDRLRALIKRARPYVQAYAAITRTDEVSLDASETAEAMRLSGRATDSRGDDNG